MDKPQPHITGHEGPTRWDWWGENPTEIVLLVFILVVFAFVLWLPPQGWGIDENPAAAGEQASAPRLVH